MGTKFKVTKSNQAAEYKGQTYYFCCGGCPDAFKKDPEKYIKAQSEQDKHKGHNH
ncbi:MAG: YHS domain-containing protein [Planctomycetes bacterium]|nr:YHS domain-containing protein [Planctomycetota bacterium]MCK5578194.1 YHS domain-containing protein [Planctomycetota bacterium]